MDMRSSQRGVAITEFALVVPLLLLLALITTEYGRAVYQYNTLTKTVRDAARYLSMQSPGGGISAAKHLVVYGDPSNTSSPLAIGLDVSQVPDPVWQLRGTGPVINTVTVRIAGCATSAPPCYSFTPLFGSVFGVAFGTVNFSDISATMRAPL
jgi:hypothetical protein